MSTRCHTEWGGALVHSPRIQQAGSGGAAGCPVIEGTDGTVTLRGDFAFKKLHRDDAFEREVCILHQLTPHPNILSPLSVLEERRIVIFRRYFSDLLRILLSEEWAERLDKEACLLGILDALTYLQGVYLVHRDIKPENILLNGLHRRNRPVLCDFARATFAPSPLDSKFSGTWAYAAPEALRGRCSLAGDIWSTGTVLFCLFEQLSPFDEEDPITSSKKNWSRPGVPEPALPFTESAWKGSLRKATKVLVRGMLTVNEDARSSAEAVKEFTQAHRNAGADEEFASAHSAEAVEEFTSAHSAEAVGEFTLAPRSAENSMSGISAPVLALVRASSRASTNSLLAELPQHGFSRAVVNAALHQLMEQGLVLRSPDVPPVWSAAPTSTNGNAARRLRGAAVPSTHCVIDLGNVHDCLKNLEPYAAEGLVSVAAYADIAFAGYGVSPSVSGPHLQVFQANTPDKNSADVQIIWDVCQLTAQWGIERPGEEFHIVVATKDLGFLRLKNLVEGRGFPHRLTFVRNWQTLRMFVE